MFGVVRPMVDGWVIISVGFLLYCCGHAGGTLTTPDKKAMVEMSGWTWISVL